LLRPPDVEARDLVLERARARHRARDHREERMNDGRAHGLRERAVRARDEDGEEDPERSLARARRGRDDVGELAPAAPPLVRSRRRDATAATVTQPALFEQHGRLPRTASASTGRAATLYVV